MGTKITTVKVKYQMFCNRHDCKDGSKRNQFVVTQDELEIHIDNGGLTCPVCGSGDWLHYIVTPIIEKKEVHVVPE